MTDQPIPARSWLILAVSVLAAAASAAVTAGTPFLIPALHSDRGLSLAGAGLLVAMPSIGTALTLIGWGWIVDRSGEKRVLVAGAGITAIALLGAATADRIYPGSVTVLGVFLLLAGSGAASANSASGRVVVGWFPARRRGLAMGIRQMAQPLGAAIAAVGLPLLAQSHGIAAALLLPCALAATGALAAWVVVSDPPRQVRPTPPPGGRAHNPYRDATFLWRIHSVSVLLVIPQALMQGFFLAWLVLGHSWNPVDAALVVMVAQLAGALARIGAGAWSDRVGSRTAPLGTVAFAAVAGFAVLAVADATGLPSIVTVTMGVVVTVISVTDNGLAFTAVAEHAGPFWSGRALGAQNTAQFATISLTTPTMGFVIAHAGYWPAFAIAAVVAALAVPALPRRDEPSHDTTTG